MAICSSRSELIESSIIDIKTETISLIDAGTGAQESSVQVPLGNAGTLLIGRSLDAAANRAAARKVPYANNARSDVALV